MACYSHQITGCRLQGLSPDPSRPIEFVEAGKPVKFICQITDSDKMTNSHDRDSNNDGLYKLDLFFITDGSHSFKSLLVICNKLSSY